MAGSMAGARSNTKYRINLDLIERIQFMMSQWVGQWVGSCQITKNQINFEVIKIIQLWTFWTFLDIFT